MLRAFSNKIDFIIEWTGKILSIFIFAMVITLMYEVLVRYLFNAPTNWAHELNQYLFSTYSLLGGAFVLLHFQHVRVEIVYNWFPPRVRAIIDSFNSLTLFLFMGVMLYQGVLMAYKSISIHEMSQSPWHPPVYPLRVMVPLAALLMIIQGLAHFGRAIMKAIGTK